MKKENVLFSLIISIRYQSAFHGVDLSVLHAEAMKEYFRQPIVDTFDIRICMSKSVRHVVNFLTDKEDDLHKISTLLLRNVFCHCLNYLFLQST